jgi:pimeloyl-ACP methyl ester carboxylesterase
MLGMRENNQPVRSLARRAAIVFAALLIAFGVVSAPATAAPVTSSPARSTYHTSDPIYFIHGFSAQSKVNCASSWNDTRNLFRSMGQTGKFISWGYYSGDTHCTRQTVNGSNTTDIDDISKALAWDIWNNYTKHGAWVSVVGHSMGGLILASMMGKVSVGTSGYPSYLRVRDAVTISTPFNGATVTGWFKVCLVALIRECKQMKKGSNFLTFVNREAPLTTDWTVLGTRGSDKSVSYTSATHLKAKWKGYYSDGQGITHSNVLHKTTGSSWHLHRSNDYGSTWTPVTQGAAPMYWAGLAIWSDTE